MTANAAPQAAGVSGGAGVPRHVAIIMDGNGRWAKKRFLPRVAGHRAGVEAVRRAVKAAPRIGIEVLTLYAFSSENWKRPADEVSDLMGLLKHYLQSEIDELHENGIRLKFIGDHSRLSAELVKLLQKSAERTAGNTRMTLVLALNYGSQDELARAVRGLIADGTPAEQVTEEAIAARLDTADLPLPDLIIRTSGEQRLSNFLLWQAAYAELAFTDELWPDFNEASLQRLVDEYLRRERRYGGL
ncbi:isoprenyl transferase [Sphingoaurantiacus capsulatus]|uniref:Isoprenyl transferase n=1 Tax=Sphingoaurantiacus capsulatus TaxID=1771310 RepID=A0ABV7XFL0_9SPHN